MDLLRRRLVAAILATPWAQWPRHRLMSPGVKRRIGVIYLPSREAVESVPRKKGSSRGARLDRRRNPGPREALRGWGCHAIRSPRPAARRGKRRRPAGGGGPLHAGDAEGHDDDPHLRDRGRPRRQRFREEHGAPRWEHHRPLRGLRRVLRKGDRAAEDSLARAGAPRHLQHCLRCCVPARPTPSG
jgi:hypothetical protein